MLPTKTFKVKKEAAFHKQQTFHWEKCFGFYYQGEKALIKPLYYHLIAACSNIIYINVTYSLKLIFPISI